jgi:DNA-directed RNA polymerase specialized sigma subunit
VKKPPKTDDNTIKGIYNLATAYASRLSSHPYSSYLDTDDLIQEGMIAYLQGRHIKQGILTAYRASTTLKRTQVGKIPQPILQTIDKITEIFDPRTIDILHRRFKLGQTLSDIGQAHQVGESGIKYIVDNAIIKLQRRLK